MKVLSTEGLTKLIQLIKSTFIPASDTVSATTVTLADVATSGDIGDLTNVTLTTPSSGQVLSYDGSKWVNSSTGAGVTDVEVNGTSVVSGGVASVSVPTQASDINALPDSTKYGADLDLTGGTLQLLDQDGNALGNSVTVPDTANFVQKTGDTMTGALNIKTNQRPLYLVGTGMTKGTTPENQQLNQIVFNDSVNSSDTATSRLGVVEHGLDTSGNSIMKVAAVRNTAGSTNAATLELKETNGGVASCTFPNTTCVDGQWVKVNTGGDIATGVSPNGSSNLSYTVTQLPNDGNMYEAMITVTGQTDSTSGHLCPAYIYSDFTSGGGSYICVFRAQTRTSSSIYGGGTIILPVTSTRKIYLIRSSNYYGSIDISIRAYRRIGTNS